MENDGLPSPVTRVGGIEFIAKEPGTVVMTPEGYDTVTDERVIFAGTRAYVTPANFEKLKARVER